MLSCDDLKKKHLTIYSGLFMFDVFELIKPMTRGNAGERDGSTEVAH